MIQYYGTSQPACIPLWVRAQLFKLMFRYQSPMRLALHDILDGTLPGKVVYAIEGEKVLSWGLFIWREGCCAPEIMMYTRASARGRGLAADCFWGLRLSIHPDGGYTYYPHDKAAYGFYMRMYAMRCAGKIPASKVTWLKQ